MVACSVILVSNQVSDSVFTARRYASAVCAVVVCLSVCSLCPFVRHKPVLYQKTWRTCKTMETALYSGPGRTALYTDFHKNPSLLDHCINISTKVILIFSSNAFCVFIVFMCSLCSTCIVLICILMCVCRILINIAYLLITYLLLTYLLTY